MTIMSIVQSEIDRALTLIRNKIREQGFTQLEVQEALSWGRSYISQLLTKQKSLRVEQILLILDVIGVEPAEFYSELYRLKPSDHPDLDDSRAEGRYRSVTYDSPSKMAGPGNSDRSFVELSSLLRGLARLLVDKQVINIDELTSTVKECESRPMMPGKNP